MELAYKFDGGLSALDTGGVPVWTGGMSPRYTIIALAQARAGKFSQWSLALGARERGGRW